MALKKWGCASAASCLLGIAACSPTASKPETPLAPPGKIEVKRIQAKEIQPPPEKTRP